jgi:hypothetical protein
MAIELDIRCMPWRNSRAHRTLFNFAIVFAKIVKPD